MSEYNTTQLKIDEAVSLLKKYSCKSIGNIDSDIEKQQLRQALLLVVSLSEWENIGICAKNETEGIMALKSYLKGLGYESELNSYSFQDVRDNKSDSPVYIKCNTQKLSYYLDSYLGEGRGVLVAIQGEDNNIIGTYGYFPLDLFTA